MDLKRGILRCRCAIGFAHCLSRWCCCMGSKSIAMEGHVVLAVQYGVGSGCSSLSMMKGDGVRTMEPIVLLQCRGIHGAERLIRLVVV